MMSFFSQSPSSVKSVKTDEPFELELEGKIEGGLELCYEEWGPSNADKVVLLFPSFSMGSHARSTVADPTHGWYEAFVGGGGSKGIDTDVYRVICPANLGSPFGSTSPMSVDPGTGKPFGVSFPQITPADIARAARLLLRKLNIESLHCVVGGSLGGNITLSFLSLFPDLSSSGIAMCCTGRTSPLTVGLRHVQRQAIRTDPNYLNGDYWKHGVFPDRGMAVARQLAMMLYKSWEDFNVRHDWKAQAPYHFNSTATFDIERYLTYQGSKFRYDPNCYLLLSKCSDLTDLQFRGASSMGTAAQVGESFLDAVLRIRCNLLLIGASSDIVIPVSELRQIHDILNAAGRNSTLDVSNSVHGHDAFIIDADYFIPRIRKFLRTQNISHAARKGVAVKSKQ